MSRSGATRAMGIGACRMVAGNPLYALTAASWQPTGSDIRAAESLIGGSSPVLGAGKKWADNASHNKFHWRREHGRIEDIRTARGRPALFLESCVLRRSEGHDLRRRFGGV